MCRFTQNIISHAIAGKCAAADPESFAHSAAAGGSSAGEEQQTIWSYVSAHRSAGGHMDLHFCMFERRRRFGVTFLHIAAPAVIWTYVSAYASVAGGGAGANVAVTQVSCTLEALRREMQVLTISSGFESCAHFEQR